MGGLLSRLLLCRRDFVEQLFRPAAIGRTVDAPIGKAGHDAGHHGIRRRCQSGGNSAIGTPVTDASMFARVLEYFRAKYGAKNVGSLYPHPNVAVEIPLA